MFAGFKIRYSSVSPTGALVPPRLPWPIALQQKSEGVQK